MRSDTGATVVKRALILPASGNVTTLSRQATGNVTTPKQCATGNVTTQEPAFMVPETPEQMAACLWSRASRTN